MKDRSFASDSNVRLDGRDMPSSGARRARFAQTAGERRIVRDILLITRLSWALPTALDEAHGNGHAA